MNARLKADSASRRGFTLVELLVMIVIIGILSSLVLGGLFLAQEKAKATRTRALVTRLNQAIMARMESYRTRRLPISTSASNQYDAAIVRRQMIRDLMRMEMPDRWTDVSDGHITPGMPALWRPALSAAYFRRYDNNVNEAGVSMAPTDLEQNAECLYLIITMGGLDEEASALDRFRHEDVEDTDQDGVPEFVDGWGNPIRFLRWAPGFVSDLQPDANPTDDPSTPEVDIERDPVNNHDPFDPLKTDPPVGMPPAAAAVRGWRLVPLIYSAGPDGVYDIRGDFLDDGGSLLHYNATTLFPNDPYHDPDSASTDNTRFIGGAHDFEADGLNHIDNIHNHLLGGAVR